ncbi:STAS domain-containing protein [Metapseudomonas resinovorans]|uniref:STAS domain-containing protein n=1 Tax=Metapseudomonas resinovorans TaxID=53412 RepID=UPI000400FC17|nr:STAS domain-containing protein [Pseudomonas resinovorans]MDE3738451.1 STAS domain-containing protein [Pseudomonas resinovorans]
MSEARIEQAAPGELRLVGVLDFSTGPQLREAGKQMIRASKGAGLLLDCSAVEKTSSVGLALLLAFMRDAEAAGKAVTVRGMPEDMRQIAEVSGVTELLPLEA